MALNVSCPACGAAIPFKSRASIFGVCGFCRNAVALKGVNAETIGKMSEMPPDMSPLKIGTTGYFDGKRFELIGRAKMTWSAGHWNEWYALFDDGRDGWLADAQGFYLMSFENREPGALPAKDGLSVGHPVQLAGTTYKVDDLREVKCAASEGELSLEARAGREALNVDLSAEQGRFAGLEYGPQGTRVFQGKYADFEDFRFQNLREFDGW